MYWAMTPGQLRHVKGDTEAAEHHPDQGFPGFTVEELHPITR